MTLADLFKETMNVDCNEVWENERTPTSVRVFGVRLHSMRLSLREVVVVLDWLGVERSHGAIWNWTHILSEGQARRRRVGVDEKQIEVDGEAKWLYATIDTESMLLLDIGVFSRRGIGPRRRSSMASPRNTTSLIQSFWSVVWAT